MRSLIGRRTGCAFRMAQALRPRLQLTILALAHWRTVAYPNTRQSHHAKGCHSTSTQHRGLCSCDVRHRGLRNMALPRQPHPTATVQLLGTCDRTCRFNINTYTGRRNTEVPYPHDGFCTPRHSARRSNELRPPTSSAGRTTPERSR